MATNTLNLRLQLKGDTAANWASSTLVPLKNEMCIESDTRKVKIGDGVNEYPDLKYINLTPEEVAELIDAANHTHDNKSVLDNTTASFTTGLLAKLNGIAEGANKTVVDSALSSTSTNPVQNKVINTALGNKVDKVTGKALSTNDFTDAYKTKLDGIAEGANKYTLPTASSTTLGGVKIGANVAISSGVISVPEGTTSAKGVVQLTDATNSTSTTTAATPASVKSAYDLANTANTAAAAAQSTADSKVGEVSIATGSANGKIAITVDGTTTEASVKGLGSSAYTNTSAFATAAQGTKADNAMPKSGGAFTGAVTLNADPTANLGAATKQYVDSQITSKLAASDAMVFKGTLGTDGTVTAVPTTGVVKGDKTVKNNL